MVCPYDNTAIISDPNGTCTGLIALEVASIVITSGVASD